MGEFFFALRRGVEHVAELLDLGLGLLGGGLLGEDLVGELVVLGADFGDLLIAVGEFGLEVLDLGLMRA